MRKFHKTIFFTNVPLNGFYKYKDVFQIYPCDTEGIPTSKFKNHFPNFIEFWTSEDEIIKIPLEYGSLQELVNETATFLTKQDKILSLLSTFTNNLFFRYTGTTGIWGIPIIDEDNVDNSSASVWCLRLFKSPDLSKQFKIDAFSFQDRPEIIKIDFFDYYINNPNMDFDSNKTIVFPNSIDSLFDSYYKLDSATMSILDTAMSYTISAVELIENRKTLSLLASFTSVETMVNLEFKNHIPEHCSECNQLKFSVTKKFMEFLLKYVGKTEANKKKFNSYYRWRSKIVHTGEQLKTEPLFSDVPLEERKLEFNDRIEIIQLGRVAITKWLLIKGLEAELF